MSKFAATLRDEISRQVRREIKANVAPLKKAISHYRSDIAALKRQVSELERQMRRLGKVAAPRVAEAETDADGVAMRFSAKGFASLRRRLDLTLAEMGLLLGIGGQTVRHLESGMSKPRRATLEAIGRVRGMGKTQAKQTLAQMD